MKKQPIILKTQMEKLSDCLENYINDCNVKGFSPDTIDSYTQTITYFIDCIGNKNVGDVIQLDLNKYIMSMRKKGNSNSTINTRLKVLKTFFKYANVDVVFPSISRDTKKKQPYTKEELKILLAPPTKNTYSQWRSWAVANFLYATGCRATTCCTVKIKDIDFANNTIYFSKAKGNKPYYIPLSNELKRVLKKYLSLYSHTDEDFLFTNLYGEPLSRQTLKMTMREYHFKRGIQSTGLHRYRHTFAIDFLRAGGNIMYLKELLNHSDIKVTQQYLDVQLEDLQESFDQFSPLDNMKRKGIKLNI